MVRHTESYYIVVPKRADGLQPLHAVYSKHCLPAIKRVINQDKLKVTGFYKGLKTLEIPEDVIKSFDPEVKMFINVNTRSDLEQISSY